MTRKRVTKTAASLDVSNLEGPLDVAIAYLQGVQADHPEWRISTWYEYDGYQMEFVETRLENDAEYAARRAEAKAIRDAKNIRDSREKLRAAKRAEIKALQAELSQL